MRALRGEGGDRAVVPTILNHHTTIEVQSQIRHSPDVVDVAGCCAGSDVKKQALFFAVSPVSSYCLTSLRRFFLDEFSFI
jgi:hypothetical protein